MVMVDDLVQHRRSADSGRRHFVRADQLRIFGRVVSARPAHDVADDAEVASAVPGPMRRYRSRHGVNATDKQDHPDSEQFDLEYNNRQKGKTKIVLFAFLLLLFFFKSEWIINI